MRNHALASMVLAFLSLVPTPRASAQDMSAADRAAAVERVRSMADCVQREQQALQRVVTLIAQSESQRDGASDAALRRDAERAIESLVQRARDLQQSLRRCLGDSALPDPGMRVQREPPVDATDDAVGQPENSLRTVEADVELASGVRVVRAEQVDGAGRIELADVRAAMRGIAAQLQRCQESRARAGARELDLVFTVRGAGRPSAVEVERTAGGDAALEQCVRQAGRSISVPRGASGGEVVLSYRLRFGR